jgi:hypothetical protein
MASQGGRLDFILVYLPATYYSITTKYSYRLLGRHELDMGRGVSSHRLLLPSPSVIRPDSEVADQDGLNLRSAIIATRIPDTAAVATPPAGSSLEL